MSNQHDEVLKQARLFVRKELEHDSSGHDWWHIVRVTRTAKMLAMTEGADEYICELSALLHDIADEKLNESKEAGMNKVLNWLMQVGVALDVQEHVLDIIATMSFGNRAGEPPATLEGRIVQDADRLDALGAIGISRTFAYSGWKGQAIYDPELKPRDSFTREEYRSGRSTAINHFYEKLLKLKSMMNTDTARVLAEDRHERMKQFLWSFDSEWGLANESYIEESLKFRGELQRVHIVFDASSLGSLRMTLRDHPGEVPVMLEDDLMVGPLPDVSDPQGAADRMSWFRERSSGTEERDELMDTLMKAAFAWKSMPDQLAKFPLVIWVGGSASEQTGLRRLIATLPRETHVSVIHTTDALSSETVQYSHTGEIVHSKLALLLGSEQVLTLQAKDDLAQDWFRLTKEQGTLRVLKDKKLQTVPESYFDRNILEAALELGALDGTFKKSARIIGQVIGYSEQRVSDSFIEYRVRELIHDGLLDYEGELTGMRYYSISLNEKGVKAAGGSSNPRSAQYAILKSALEGLGETHFEEKTMVDELRKLVYNESDQNVEQDDLRAQLVEIIDSYQKHFEKRVELLDVLANMTQRYSNQ
ncbi:uncharacterized protein SAMN05661091_3244 [Paenibacillus uliginis N3/975]|uniref:HD domain-containing protein n=1 Tax=Paenibacillus uliginis N3/975 TaxID=1313296 RepID=A0A1X7HG43_9BACL|nr:uncharacterized protein SAMN05661091_3244 [Paenibacillus uliginis N3/975]